MLVVRCANGIVCWYRIRTGPETCSWICTADQFAVPTSQAPDSTWPSALLLVATHSAGLSGPIADVLYVPAF